MHRTRIIALAICATLVALWAVVRPDEFWVERVDFEGNVRATPAELRHLADIRNGTTIWGVDLDRVSSNVRRHPWVKRVEAERESQTMPDDETADAARMGAPDVVPIVTA